MYKPKLEKDIHCPLEYGLTVFGGKWKSRVICVFASTLKELISDDIVKRQQFGEIPPRVESCLTSKRLSVVPILQNICRWSGAYHKEEKENTRLQCQKCDYNYHG